MPTKTRPTSSDTTNLDRRKLLAALRAYKRGDFSVRLPDDLTGVDGEICSTFNTMAHQSSALSRELETLSLEVRTEGKTALRLRKSAARGDWTVMTTSVNEVLDALAAHRQEVLRVITSIARGDLDQRVDLDGPDGTMRGDFLKSARLVNEMVVSLANFGSEVTRVAQEVGVEGKLGAQARVLGVSGAWKNLTDSVNLMASSLTRQVREIARVTTAVAQGDLSQTVNIEVQ